MLAPPVVRGGSAARAVSLLAGLLLFAAGIVLLLEAELGLSPWDVLHQGLADRTGLSFGTANIVVGAAVLAVCALLGAKLGPGTVANALLVGLFVDLLLRVGWIAALDEHGLVVRAGLLVAGLVLIAVGSAFYIGADFGAGPRDSLMLVLAARTRVRIGAVRIGLEVAATAAGFALGGTVGIGTLAFAFGIGPMVEGAFRLLARSPLADPGRRPLAGPAATVAE